MSKQFVLILLIIIVIAVVVRIYGLDRQSLWWDEVYEKETAQRLFSGEKMKTTLINPPLNLFFIYPMIKIHPESDFALRIVPFTFGLISVPLMFLLGLQLFNEKVGIIASFLLALSPFHIWYSQDARMYALLWMLSLISLIYFLRTIEQPTHSNYLGFVLSSIASLYTHQVAIFLLLFQGVYLLMLLQKYKKHFLKWVSAFCAVVILYLPWIIYSISLSEKVGGGLSKKLEYLKLIPYTIFSYAAGFSIGPSLTELHTNRTLSVIKPYLFEIGLIMVVANMLVVLGVWSLRKDRQRLLFMLFLLSIPIIGVIILNKLMPTITYNVRYTAVAFFAFLLFIAKGIEWLWCQKSNFICSTLAILAVVLMTGFSLYSYVNYQFDKKYTKADIRSAVAYIKDNKMTADTILCSSIAGATIFNMYSKDNFQCSVLEIARRHDKEGIETVVRKKTEGDKRLWLVLSHEWELDKHDYAKAWLDKNYIEIKQLRKDLNEIANVRIYCYDIVKRKTT